MARQFLTPVGLPSGDTLPAVGTAGAMFYKSDENQVYAHNGTIWERVFDQNTSIALAWWMGV